MDKTKRDRLIVEAAFRGETYQAIGKRWGITRERARQIAKRNGVPQRTFVLTSEDKREILRLLKRYPVCEIAHCLNHSPQTIWSYMGRSGLVPLEKFWNTSWTPKEVATLVAHYGKRSASDIAKRLGRTRNEVIGKANRLGLCSKKEAA